MIIKISIEDPLYGRNHHIEQILPGYYMYPELLKEIDRLLEYHTLKQEQFKKDYITRWGKDFWNKNIVEAEDEAK